MLASRFLVLEVAGLASVVGLVRAEKIEVMGKSGKKGMHKKSASGDTTTEGTMKGKAPNANDAFSFVDVACARSRLGSLEKLLQFVEGQRGKFMIAHLKPPWAQSCDASRISICHVLIEPLRSASSGQAGQRFIRPILLDLVISNLKFLCFPIWMCKLDVFSQVIKVNDGC